MLSMRILINSFHSTTIWRTLATVIPKKGREPEIDYVGKLREWRDNEMKKGLIVPEFKRSFEFANQIAVYDHKGEYTYLQLYLSAKKLAFQMSNICGGGANSPVACICDPNILSAMTQWACWMSGQVSMPLGTQYTEDVMRGFLKKTNAQMIMCTQEYNGLGQRLSEEIDIACCTLDHTFLLTSDQLPKSLKKLLLIFGKDIMIEGALNNEFYTMQNALLACKLTKNGQLKTCMFNYQNFAAHTKCLLNTLDLTGTDVLLPMLPNYYMHDLLNSVFSVGGSVVMPDQKSQLDVWKTLLNVNKIHKSPVNYLYAMPLVYYQLIEQFDAHYAADKKMREHILDYCQRNIRACASGFSSLPLLVAKRWHEITGHKIIEQYGRIDTGIIMSNSPRTTKETTKTEFDVGIAGRPLCGVEMAIINDKKDILYEAKGDLWQPTVQKLKGFKYVYEFTKQQQEPEILKDAIYGELAVTGPGVIHKKTMSMEERKQLIGKKYLRTGDLVVYENGIFKIIGKVANDVIQVGENQSVYSLQVESILSRHPNIAKVIVGGLGECVTAICVLKPHSTLNLSDLKEFCCHELESFKIPTQLKIVDDLAAEELVNSNRRELVNKYFNSNLEHNKTN